jgi:uncharacterized protein (DUF488 family)
MPKLQCTGKSALLEEIAARIEPRISATMVSEECQMAEPILIFTIGHSNHPADHFLGLLQRHQIQAVIDVRTSPYSRFAPHFNGRALEQLLDPHGIEYVFAGEVLGGRPTDPMYYRTGVVPVGKADYLNLVDYPAVAQQRWYQRGVQRLLDIAATRLTAIMCSEEDPLRCHRHHLIENSVRGRGASVVHIRKDGSLTTVAPGLTEAMQESPQLALSGFD